MYCSSLGFVKRREVTGSGTSGPRGVRICGTNSGANVLQGSTTPVALPHAITEGKGERSRLISLPRRSVFARPRFPSVAVLSGWTSPHLAQTAQATVAGGLKANVANCTACHTPPDFTDRRFHNNGESLDERNQSPDAYLPATPQHPNASEIFRSPVSSKSAATDLGLWNIYANSDFSEAQSALRRLMCPDPARCNDTDVLPRTVALFRTPTLRDLEDSDPFMHSGRIPDIEGVLRYYIRTAQLAREGKLRNGAAEMRDITIEEKDIAPLAAFLRSLNEDYD